MLTFTALIFIPWYVIKTFFHNINISVSNLFNLSQPLGVIIGFNQPISSLLESYRNLFLIIGFVLVIGFMWFVRNYIERVLNGMNSRLQPLVWLFGLLAVIAIPLSVFPLYSKPSEVKPVHKKILNDFTETKPPNVIVVVMDALTLLDMQVYGYDRPTTPFLTKWTKEAITFKATYASSNWTTPTMMSFMTGQQPWTHKVWYQAVERPYNYYPNSLPAVLKEYGIDTYAFVQNIRALPETLGIQDAFTIKEGYHTLSSLKKEDKWIDNFNPYEIFQKNPIVFGWLHKFYLLNYIKGKQSIDRSITNNNVINNVTFSVMLPIHRDSASFSKKDCGQAAMTN